MTRIDAHLHFADESPEGIALIEELDLKLLNICVASGTRPWREIEREPYSRLARQHPDRFAWCTTFDPPDFDDPEYVKKAIDALDRDFAEGAVACKVWKNIGMDVKRPDGTYFMVDDPLLDPIFDHLARIGRPLLAHIGEPLACWRPLSEFSPHQQYYTQHTKYHMHGRTDAPSHAAIMAARDNVLAKHPNLKVIGAHLGSLEYDVADIAERFDKYPNFAVDVSARASDLMCLDSAIVRKWFLDYPDRILFGTDIVHRSPETLSPQERRDKYTKIRGIYDRYFTYFGSDGEIEYAGRSVKCLNLPEAVMRKFCVDNARAWYPGL